MSNNKQFFIGVDGKQIEVTEEVYIAYYRSKRRDRYFERDIKTETAIRDKDGGIIGYAPSKEDSLDRLIDSGEDFDNGQDSIEDVVIQGFTFDALHQALDSLPDADRRLIRALFFSNGGAGMTERECAEKFGISKTALHARKKKVLALLKNLLEK